MIPSIWLAWPMVRGRLALELLAGFVRKPVQRGVIEVVRQFDRLVAAVRRNVGGLPIKIDRVLGVDFELFGDFGVKGQKLGPNPRQIGHFKGRIRQQLERGPALAVLS